MFVCSDIVSGCKNKNEISNKKQKYISAKFIFLRVVIESCKFWRCARMLTPFSMLVWIQIHALFLKRKIIFRPFFRDLFPLHVCVSLLNYLCVCCEKLVVSYARNKEKGGRLILKYYSNDSKGIAISRSPALDPTLYIFVLFKEVWKRHTHTYAVYKRDTYGTREKFVSFFP